MREDVLNLLANTDTPTICNAIELAQGKRGFNAFTRGHYDVMQNTLIVDMRYARTAKIAADNPPNRTAAENKSFRV